MLVFPRSKGSSSTEPKVNQNEGAFGQAASTRPEFFSPLARMVNGGIAESRGGY